MKYIYMAGMSHKVAEIAVREKFYISMDVKINALQNSPFDELLILATCNRTEIYVASNKELESKILVQYICDLVHENYDEYASFFYIKESDEVIFHIMNVCAGLDSVAMGEDQILHQIDRAYLTALQYKATGNVLNKLFQSAIHTTKRIKSETNLSKLSCNIPFLAIKHIQKVFEDLENRSIYIIGLGEMGSLMLKYAEENTTKIFASSKTFSNAQKFQDVLTPIPFEERYSVIKESDILILCSACEEPIITFDNFVKSYKNEKLSKRLVIDLGNPRNAECTIGSLSDVDYICVDDLEQIVSQNRKLRMIELKTAQKILQEGVDEFLKWYRMDFLSKEIHIIADEMINISNIECEKLLASLPNITEMDKEKIKLMYIRFAKKMANDYLYKVKDLNSHENVQVFVNCLKALK